MEGLAQGLNRHLAAVMFTDMAGYTALMQRDEAAALRSRSRHREALEESAVDSGGRVLQYFGDGSLSLFPSSVQAVNAAVAIQRMLQRDPLVRIGLHLGDVAYDDQGAYGAAINIAARLEALAKPGGVLISRAVFEEIRSHPELRAEHVADVRLKNVRGAIATYAVLVDDTESAAVDDHERVVTELAGTGLLPVFQTRLDERAKLAPEWTAHPADPGGRIPMVGRDHEMEVVRRCLESAETGRGATLFIRGARGVGKTRVAEEAADRARARGWAVLTGRAYAAERRVPFAPFADALLPVLSGLDGETLATLVPGGTDAIVSMFPALGLRAPGDAAVHLEPGEFQARLFWHFTEILRRFAEHRPLLLVLDDLDFADRSSLELLQFVSRRCTRSPIMVICQYTGLEEQQEEALLAVERSLKVENVGTALEIRPLTEAETGLFVAMTLGVSPEGISDLTSRLFRWTEGVPFYLEGTLRGMIHTEGLEGGNHTWKGDGLRATDLPESVRDAVLVWTSRLSEVALAVGEVLSVVGTEVAYETLQYLTGLPESDFSDALDELVRSQILVEEEAEWTLVYDFRHPLIRETLRTELSPAKRRQLHGSIAEALEGYYGAAADEHAEELAYHFGHATPGPVRMKALRYLAEAGARALSQHSNREAAAHFKEALERFEAVPGGPPRETLEQQVHVERLVHGLSTALRRLGKIDESVALLRRLLSAAGEAGDSRLTSDLHRGIGLAFLRGGRVEEAIAELELAVTAAREAGEAPLLVRSQLARGICFKGTGRVEEAREALQEASALAMEAGEPVLLARAHSALIELYLFSGQLAQGRAHAETALRLAEETGAKGVAFWCHWAIGAMEGLIGDTAESARRVAEAKRLADELGSPFLKTEIAEGSIGLAYMAGDWSEGIEVGENAAALARSLGQRQVLPRLLCWLTLFYIGRGDLAKARAASDEAWDLAGAEGAEDNAGPMDVFQVVPAHIGRAAYHMAIEDWDEAVRVAKVGLAVADRSGYVVWAIHELLPIIAEASIHARRLDAAEEAGRRMRADAEKVGHPLGLAWADACDALLTWLQGDARHGAVALRKGMEALESIPLTFDAARLRRQLAGRLAEVGDLVAAEAELRRAVEVFERLEAKPELEKSWAQLEEITHEQPPG